MRAPMFVVFAKELKDGLRDRRSLTSAFLYSFFGPLVLSFALLAVGRQADERGPLPLPVAGAEHAPGLVLFLEQHGAVVEPAPADAPAAVRSGQAAAVLRLPSGYGEDFRSARSAEVELLFDSGARQSRARAERVAGLVERYGAETARQRLLARGVSPEVIRPLTLRERDYAAPGARAAATLDMLPMFLLAAVFITCMSAAIDATAGERERGSLESLLVHPVPRSAFAWGKWLAAAVLAALGLALTLAVSRAMLGAEKMQALDVVPGLDRATVTALLAVLLPVALLAPALQMLIALFSRSFKEAQTYLSLFLFVPMLPGFFFSFGSSEPARWMEWAPVVGQQLLASKVLRGEPLGLEAVGLAAATVAVAVVSATATGWLLGRERVVLGR